MLSTPDVPAPAATCEKPATSAGVSRLLAFASLRRASQKCGDGGHGQCRLLFHQPVTGIGDHRAGDIQRGEPHFIGHRRTERFLGADREHRHGQLAVRDEGFVVDGVAGKCRELFERGMHCAGPRIERRIMFARRLVDRFRIGGQFVPEAIQINALAALHQTFDVRSAEIEMPEQRALRDFFPVADAGQRRVHRHPTGDAIRKQGGERIADHIADVVRHQLGALDVELVENSGDIGRLVPFVVPALRMRREAHAAQVGNDDGMIPNEIARQRRPHVAGVAEAVQHDDCRPLAANPNVQRRVARCNLHLAKSRREWRDRGAG